MIKGGKIIEIVAGFHVPCCHAFSPKINLPMDEFFVDAPRGRR
jgi:hypothetical protein